MAGQCGDAAMARLGFYPETCWPGNAYGISTDAQRVHRDACAHVPRYNIVENQARCMIRGLRGTTRVLWTQDTRQAIRR